VPKAIHGRSAFPALEMKTTEDSAKNLGAPARYIRAENAYDLDLKKVQSRRFSMILNLRTRQCNLFNLDDDPVEQKDVLDLYPEEFKALWECMMKWLEDEKKWVKPESPTINLSEEIEERLRGLGYLK
jgi:hypothetical protein